MTDPADHAGDRPRDPDALLARAGVRGNPDSDQHYLIDDRVLDRLPTYLPEPNWEDGPALEIGAGTGALTDRLLSIAPSVVAVERDPRLVRFLRKEFATAIADGRLEIVGGDALSIELPPFGASVSNLPYGVSSEIAFRLLPAKRPMVLMFQREFAERMAATPGTEAYGRLSVSTQHYAAVEVVEVVPPTAFSPPPAVESAVVRTVPRTPTYRVPDDEFFLRFVKALFTQRRKTIRNGIRNTAHISGLSDPNAVVEAIDEDVLAKRPEAVTPATFAELATIAAEIEGDVS